MGVNRVRAFTYVLNDSVSQSINHVGVIPGVAGHHIRSRPAGQQVMTCSAAEGIVAVQAIQFVAAAVADKGIVKRIAGAADRAGARQGQVFHVVGKGMVHA